MPKYSTGDRSGGAESCELCGTQSKDLTTATVAGAELELCSECLPHGESENEQHTTSDREQESRRRAAQNVAKLADTRSGDSSRWEREGTNYDSDPLPYLVSGYGDRVRTAREDADLTVEDLAADLDADVEALRAVEEGRAARAGVGGSLIAALEERLDVTVAESEK